MTNVKRKLAEFFDVWNGKYFRAFKWKKLMVDLIWFKLIKYVADFTLCSVKNEDDFRI